MLPSKPLKIHKEKYIKSTVQSNFEAASFPSLTSLYAVDAASSTDPCIGDETEKL